MSKKTFLYKKLKMSLSMKKINKMTCVPNEDQLSLGIRPVWSVFAWKRVGSLATYKAHSEDWSDWAHAQADLSLQWAHMSLYWFCRALLVFLQQVAGYYKQSHYSSLLQYKTERNGVIETRVERKITVTSDEMDDIDHDAVSCFHCFVCDSLILQLSILRYRGSHMSGHFIRNLWKEPLASFINFIWKDHKCKILFIIWMF